MAPESFWIISKAVPAVLTNSLFSRVMFLLRFLVSSPIRPPWEDQGPA